jgi:GNAT superfamily N-acetyltransferase
MVVRRRTDIDLDALAQVVARVRAADDYPTYLPGDDYHRFLTRPEPLEAWVSEWDARICGHVALNAQPSPGAMQVLHDAGIVGPLGAIARLLVDPDARGRGIARALLQTARSAAVTQHRVPVLEVVESSHAAIALYRRSGWVELGRTALALPDGRELRELVFASGG